ELRKEIKDVKSEIAEIRKTLKDFILKSGENDNNISPPRTPIGLPQLTSNMCGPRNTSLPNKPGTVSPVIQIATNSAPNLMNQEKKLSEHGSPGTQFLRRLVLTNECDVGNLKYGGRTSGVEIPDTNINILNSLKPARWVDEEVINQLACSIGDSALENYKKMFMGKIDLIRKIFVPINDQNSHWYLMVIDMNKRQLVLLDSLPCAKRREWRRRHVKKVAMYVEEMILDHTFYDISISTYPVISEFELIEPQGIAEQTPASNDCGVWVCQWMTSYIVDDDYESINVTPASRMRISIDLVLHLYNKLRREVITSAFNAWDEQRLRSKKRVQKK
ncbi:Ulp1 protease family, C-terminal catalytic domain, partial [Sesbania bispinosa]